MALGTFNLVIDADLLDGRTDTTAKVTVTLLETTFLVDGNQFRFQNELANGVSTSLPYTAVLPTDVAAGGGLSAAIGYAVTVTNAYGSTVRKELAARAAGDTVYLSSITVAESVDVSANLNDTVVSGLVGAGGSATRAVLNADFVNKGELAFHVADDGAVGGAADDTLAVQATIDRLAAYMVTDPPLSRPRVIDGQGLICTITDSLDITGLQQGRGWKIKNLTIVAKCAGKIALDLTASRFGNFENVRIYGDATATPHTGMALSKSATETCTHNMLQGVTIDGHFTSSALHLNSAEENYFQHCMFVNRRTADAGGESWAVILDGAGYKALPSQYQTPSTARASFTVNKFDKCTIQKPFGITGPTMFMQDASSISFESCYLTNGGGSGVVWRLTDGFTPYRVYMDFQIETTGIDNFIEFTSDGVTGVHEIRGLHCTFGNMFTDSEVFEVSASVTSLALRSFKAHIYRWASGVTPTGDLFASPSKVSIYGGDIVVPAASDMNAASMFARLDATVLGMDGTFSEYGPGTSAHARKTADQTVSNSTTLVNDTALTLPVAANAVYEVTGQVIYSTSTTADLSAKFAAPTGAAMDWAYQGYGSAVTGSPSTVNLARQAIGNTATPGGVGTGSRLAFRPHGILTTSATAGDLVFQFAQSTAEVSDTVVHAGSFLKLTRIS